MNGSSDVFVEVTLLTLHPPPTPTLTLSLTLALALTLTLNLTLTLTLTLALTLILTLTPGQDSSIWLESHFCGQKCEEGQSGPRCYLQR